MELIDFQNPSLNFEKFNQSFGQYVYGNLQEIYTKNKKDSVFFYELGLLNEEWNLQKKINEINVSLVVGDLFICRIYSLENWRINKIAILKIPVIGYIFKLYSFILFRVFPRIINLNSVSNFFNLKNRKLISKAEMMGRLSLAGFELISVTSSHKNHFFLTRKIKEFEDVKIKTGLIIKLSRVGKNGNLFNLYKIRTMHPYSEFIHSYMISNNGFNSTGKIQSDFRMTRWARFLRKYWIDEIPQLINLLKGDMKLVGIRPVSLSYLQTLTEDVQNLRKNMKPGCIPPYLAMNMDSSLNSVIQ
jgi:hypothetical protein